MRHLLIQMKPRGLIDVIQSLALVRPGAATIGDLPAEEVEDWAAKLGYGIFRVGVGRDVFLPHGRSR